MKALGFAKAFSQQIATFVLMLSTIFQDLIYFVLVLLMIIAMFGGALYLVLAPLDEVGGDPYFINQTAANYPATNGTAANYSKYDYDEEDCEAPPSVLLFDKIHSTFFSLYLMLLGKLDEPEPFYASPLATALFMLYSFVVFIILLNVLIAIVGDSYDAVLVKSTELFWRSRLELIAEINTVFEWFLCGDVDEWSKRGAESRRRLRVMWGAERDHSWSITNNKGTLVLRVLLLPVLLPTTIFLLMYCILLVTIHWIWRLNLAIGNRESIVESLQQERDFLILLLRKVQRIVILPASIPTNRFKQHFVLFLISAIGMGGLVFFSFRVDSPSDLLWIPFFILVFIFHHPLMKDLFWKPWIVTAFELQRTAPRIIFNFFLLPISISQAFVAACLIFLNYLGTTFLWFFFRIPDLFKSKEGDGLDLRLDSASTDWSGRVLDIVRRVNNVTTSETAKQNDAIARLEEENKARRKENEKITMMLAMIMEHHKIPLPRGDDDDVNKDRFDQDDGKRKEKDEEDTAGDKNQADGEEPKGNKDPEDDDDDDDKNPPPKDKCEREKLFFEEQRSTKEAEKKAKWEADSKLNLEERAKLEAEKKNTADLAASMEARMHRLAIDNAGGKPSSERSEKNSQENGGRGGGRERGRGRGRGGEANTFKAFGSSGSLEAAGVEMNPINAERIAENQL